MWFVDGGKSARNRHTTCTRSDWVAQATDGVMYDSSESAITSQWCDRCLELHGMVSVGILTLSLSQPLALSVSSKSVLNIV